MRVIIVERERSDVSAGNGDGSDDNAIVTEFFKGSGDVRCKNCFVGLRTFRAVMRQHGADSSHRRIMARSACILGCSKGNAN
jgi:hypothetical protein